MEYRALTSLSKYENNPRTIKKDDMDKLVKSIRDNKDYFEARPIILSDRTGELVIIGGNQRYEASKILGLEEVPTYLIKDLTEEREKEIMIRDNVNNGEWDYDILGNEWDDLPLEDWGVGVPNFEDLGDLHNVKSDNFIIHYDLIFDNLEQQDIFFNFLKYLKANIDGETISERLVSFIKKCQESKNI